MPSKMCPNCNNGKYYLVGAKKCPICNTKMILDTTGEGDRLANEAFQKRQEERLKREAENPTPPPPPVRNVPHCPTCNSTNVEALSTTRKVAGLLTVGLASKSVGKSYRCKNCKYYW